MFTHIMVGADDVAAAQRFYDATFEALGIPAGTADAKGRVHYAHAGNRFIVTKPIDGNPATFANGGTIGFPAASPEAASAWHAAGVANGGTSCEGAPGPREMADGRVLYLAYLRDPAGNKLCVLHQVNA